MGWKYFHNSLLARFLTFFSFNWVISFLNSHSKLRLFVFETLAKLCCTGFVCKQRHWDKERNYKALDELEQGQGTALSNHSWKQIIYAIKIWDKSFTNLSFLSPSINSSNKHQRMKSWSWQRKTSRYQSLSHSSCMFKCCSKRNAWRWHDAIN